MAIPDGLEELPNTESHPWRVTRVSDTIHLATNGSYNVEHNFEAETLFVAYLPRSKVLVHDGDLFRKYRRGPLRRRRRGSVALERFIDESGIDVELLVGNRGVPATMEDLRQTNSRQRLRF